jgi:hypothetical protein
MVIRVGDHVRSDRMVLLVLLLLVCVEKSRHYEGIDRGTLLIGVAPE